MNGVDPEVLERDYGRMTGRVVEIEHHLSRMIEILWQHLPQGGYYTEDAEIRAAERALGRRLG